MAGLFTLSFTQAITLSQSPTIKGHIDSIIFEKNQNNINDRHCQVGHPPQIQLQVYL